MKPSSFTTSRREFIGKAGTIRAPQALKPPFALSGATELDGDPAAVSQSISKSVLEKSVTSRSSWATRRRGKRPKP
ncbi:hypothetical protein AJ87_33630 [Rhizobium yanglingense]|nr:hypothetical protein AJ87_33630 [Rhizobium yanglingense]